MWRGPCVGPGAPGSFSPAIPTQSASSRFPCAWRAFYTTSCRAGGSTACRALSRVPGAGPGRAAGRLAAGKSPFRTPPPTSPPPSLPPPLDPWLLYAPAPSGLQRLLSRAHPALASSALWRRTGVALSALCLLRLGAHLPVVSRRALWGWLNGGEGLPDGFSQPGHQGPDVLGESISADWDLSIFRLGITPLMNASFALALLQLLPPVRAHFGRLRDQGARDAIKAHLSRLFSTAAALQAWLVAGHVVAAHAPGAAPGAGTRAARLGLALALFGGAWFVRRLVDLLDERGLGDGVGLTLAAGAALRAGPVAAAALVGVLARRPALWRVAICAAALLALLLGSLAAQDAHVRLPVAYHRQARGGAGGYSGSVASSAGSADGPPLAPARETARQALGSAASPVATLEQRSYFPLPLAPHGTRTLLFVSFWVTALRAPLAWVGLGGLLDRWWLMPAVIFFVEGVALPDGLASHLAAFLAMSEATIPNTLPGPATAHILETRRTQLRVLNAAFLSCAWLAAYLVDGLCGRLLGASFQTPSLLLMASIAGGGARQVQALAALPRAQLAFARSPGGEALYRAIGEAKGREMEI